MSMLPVKTEAFEGPLDLLLNLIERNDLDITAVSLVQVTDQYLAALRSGAGIDYKALADFVAVAAKLLLLKSRALLPRTADQIEADDLEAEEIAQDLTAQLEEYRRFKAAAGMLRDLDEKGHRSFTRVAAVPEEWLPTGLEKVTLKKLMGYLSKTLARLPAEAEPERISRPLMNLGQRRIVILNSLRRSGSLTFTKLLETAQTRFEVIITFLAILDLFKTNDIAFEQPEAFGDIYLTLPGMAPAVATTA
jgi:segregation and condensation protein A